MNDKTNICPCCLAQYSQLDAPAEFERVGLWNIGHSKEMASALGRMSKGIGKRLTGAERKRRAQRMAHARTFRARKET